LPVIIVVCISYGFLIEKSRRDSFISPQVEKPSSKSGLLKVLLTQFLLLISNIESHLNNLNTCKCLKQKENQDEVWDLTGKSAIHSSKLESTPTYYNIKKDKDKEATLCSQITREGLCTKKVHYYQLKDAIFVYNLLFHFSIR